jgi:hypothetical protein
MQRLRPCSGLPQARWSGRGLFHKRQREIDPHGRASGGPYPTVAHKDRNGLDAHGGKALSQPGAILPVGRRATTAPCAWPPSSATRPHRPSSSYGLRAGTVLRQRYARDGAIPDPGSGTPIGADHHGAARASGVSPPNSASRFRLPPEDEPRRRRSSFGENRGFIGAPAKGCGPK